MPKDALAARLRSGLLFGDGSTGVQLTLRGMPAGVCPEQWCAEHPDIVTALHRDYIAAGSGFISTPTFGGSPLKLDKFGLSAQTWQINAALARLSRAAVQGTDVLVAANIGPTGELMEPMGMTTFEQVLQGYREQVMGLLEGEPDFFLLETFMDVAEARAAVIAIKQCCDLPIVVGFTFEGARTLTGASPQSIAILFEALGAAAVGCNCSGGPDTLVDIITQMRRVSNLALFAKPNAGIPHMQGDQTVFDVQPDDFADAMPRLVRAGAAIIGGCCGTGPAHIRAMVQACADVRPPAPAAPAAFTLASSRRYLQHTDADGLLIIGTAITPNTDGELADALRDGDLGAATQLAREQYSNGAHIVSINTALDAADEVALLRDTVLEVAGFSGVPLSISSTNSDALRATLREYPGKALLHAVTPGEHSAPLLRDAALYGAAVVLLPIEAAQLPADNHQRMRLAEALMDQALAAGICPENILMDCAAPAIAQCNTAALQAVAFARQCHERGWRTVAGIYAISHGLPARERANAAYLSMLCGAGLYAAMLNPTQDMLDTAVACNLLRGSDSHCAAYREHFHR